MREVKLYRPVGLKEWELIKTSGWKEFPPRLAWQPIFYPVLNQAYAEQIAEDWNTNDPSSGYCGIVTGFLLKEEFFSRYEVQNVGGILHNELWVPAGELELFNHNIIGEIHILKVYFGEQFIMPADEELRRELLKFKDHEI